MLMYSGAEYVATASTSHPQDLDRKVRAALTRLPAFIQILTPCNPSWGYDDDQGIEVSRLAVNSGMWPLYEWKDGDFRRQRIPRKATVREYVGSQRRYAHMTDDDIELLEGYVSDLDGMLAGLETRVRRLADHLKRLSRLSFPRQIGYLTTKQRESMRFGHL